jgi:hypothetical protein
MPPKFAAVAQLTASAAAAVPFAMFAAPIKAVARLRSITRRQTRQSAQPQHALGQMHIETFAGQSWTGVTEAIVEAGEGCILIYFISEGSSDQCISGAW